MSYQTIKDGISLRLKGLGLAPSKETFDYIDAPASEYDHTFIVFKPTSERSEVNHTISDRYRDKQVWMVKVAFKKSRNNNTSQLDTAERKAEAIKKDLDNPANTSFCLMCQYLDATTEELEDYFLVTVNLLITDQVTY